MGANQGFKWRTPRKQESDYPVVGGLPPLTSRLDARYPLRPDPSIPEAEGADAAAAYRRETQRYELQQKEIELRRALGFQGVPLGLPRSPQDAEAALAEALGVPMQRGRTPGSALARLDPTVWRPEDAEQAMLSLTPLEAEHGGSFMTSAARFAGTAVVETLRTFNPFESGIEGRERLFRTANVASLALPLGWLAQAFRSTRLMAAFPTLRALAATGKGRVALTALETSAVSAGTELLRSPEARGEHGIVIAALGGAVAGAGTQAVVDKLGRSARLKRTGRIAERFRSPEELARTDGLGPLMQEPYAILTPQIDPEDLGGAVPPTDWTSVRTRQFQEQIAAQGYDAVRVKLPGSATTSRSRDAWLIPGLDESSARLLASELAQRRVITDRGLLDLENGVVYPHDWRKTRVGTEVDFKGSHPDDYVIFSEAGDVPVVYGFDRQNPQRLGGQGTRAAATLAERVIDKSSEEGLLLSSARIFRDLDVREVGEVLYRNVVRSISGLEREELSGRLLRDAGEGVAEKLRGSATEFAEGLVTPVSESPSKLLQLARGDWSSWTQHAVTSRTLRSFDDPSQVIGQGLMPALEDAGITSDTLELLVEYGDAMHAREVLEAGFAAPKGYEELFKQPGDVRATKLDDLIDELAHSAPELPKAFMAFQEWRRTIVQETVQAYGLVKDNAYAEAVERWRYYVPWRAADAPALRLDDDAPGLLESATRAPRGVVSGRNPLRRMTEGLKAPERHKPWLTEAVAEAAAMARMASQQRAINALHARVYATGNPGWLFPLMESVATSEVRSIRTLAAASVDAGEAMRAAARRAYEEAEALSLNDEYTKKLVQERVREAADLAESLASEAASDDLPSLLGRKLSADGQRYVRSTYGGESTWWRIKDDALWDAVATLTPTELNLMEKIAGTPAKYMRLGTTGAAEFATKAVGRDLVFAFVNAGVNPLAALKGFLSLARRDEFFDQWMAAGGARAALSSVDRRPSAEALQSMAFPGTRAEGVMRPVRAALNLPQMFVQLSEFLENGTRVGVFRSKLGELQKAAAAKGGPVPKPSDLVREAALAAREGTVDFQMVGAHRLAASMRVITTFWNAALQGTDTVVQTAARDPQGFLTRATVGITLPSVALYLVNRKDPEYTQLPEWERRLFWHVKRSSLGPVGSALGEDPGAEDDLWLRFPKPFEPGMIFGSIPEAALEALDAEDPSALDEYTATVAHELFSAFLMPPTLLGAPLEIARNKSFLTGGAIVSESLEDVAPEHSGSPSSSEFALGLARMLNGSDEDPTDGVRPQQIDHLVRGYTGGLGTFVTKTLGDLAVETYQGKIIGTPAHQRVLKPQQDFLQAFPLTRGFVSSYPYASSTMSDYYEAAEDARVAVRTQQHLEESLQTDDMVEWVTTRVELLGLAQDFQETSTLIAELRQQRLEVENLPGMSRDEKRRTLYGINKAMLVAADAMNQAAQDVMKQRRGGIR